MTLKPFLKYCGGKTWLAPRLSAMYEPYRPLHTWVEPFCGALGATLGVMPERAILSDVNPHLINLYRQIENGIPNDAQKFGITEPEYYEIRESFNNNFLNFLYERFNANAFYYLNRTCHRGLCRFNRKGEFNVPYGHYKNPKLNHDFGEYQQAFKKWGFFQFKYDTTLDYSENISSPRFIYADPPYDDGFVNYSGSFTWNDQVNLATQLAELDCPVVASNKATDRIVDLYLGLGFNIEIISAPRRISCNGDRTPVNEILATKGINP